MAKLMLIGSVAQVELTSDSLEGQVFATCVIHPAFRREYGGLCSWAARYDDMNDATGYAADHADTGRQDAS